MRSIFFRTRDIGVKLVSACPAGRAHYAWCGHFVACVLFLGIIRCFGPAVGRRLHLWWGDAGGEEEFFVDGDEESFAAGQDGAVWVLDLGLMEELSAWCAVFCGAVEMEADEDERLVERDGAKIVDLHMAGHGEDVEGAIELAHGFVE